MRDAASQRLHRRLGSRRLVLRRRRSSSSPARRARGRARAAKRPAAIAALHASGSRTRSGLDRRASRRTARRPSPRFRRARSAGTSRRAAGSPCGCRASCRGCPGARSYAFSDLRITNGARVIDSAPPAIATSMTSALIAWNAEFSACRPLPHRRFIVAPGTLVGSPASSVAMRPALRQSSPAWFAAPQNTSSMSAGSIPCARPARGSRTIRDRPVGQARARRRSAPSAYGAHRRRRLQTPRPAWQRSKKTLARRVLARPVRGK